MIAEFNKILKFIPIQLAQLVMAHDAMIEAEQRCPKGVSPPWSL